MPDEVPDTDEEYVLAKISQVGFVDPQGQEGVVILKTFEGREFPMRAFSGEVARHILRFRDGDKNLDGQRHRIGPGTAGGHRGKLEGF